jgi:hypothetical protein
MVAEMRARQSADRAARKLAEQNRTDKVFHELSSEDARWLYRDAKTLPEPVRN